MVCGEIRAPREENVSTIHCHFCGGVIQDVATIEFRPPRASAQFALPQSTPCTCTPPIVYEDVPLLEATDGDSST